MPVTPGEPLTKVTLNIYTEDLEYLRKHFGYGWSTELRELIHDYLNRKRRANG